MIIMKIITYIPKLTNSKSNAQNGRVSSKTPRSRENLFNIRPFGDKIFSENNMELSIRIESKNRVHGSYQRDSLQTFASVISESF